MREFQKVSNAAKAKIPFSKGSRPKKKRTSRLARDAEFGGTGSSEGTFEDKFHSADPLAVADDSEASQELSKEYLIPIGERFPGSDVVSVSLDNIEQVSEENLYYNDFVNLIYTPRLSIPIAAEDQS